MKTYRARALSSIKRVFDCDLRALALFRVSLGGLLILDLLLRTRDFRAHYTDFGIFPAGALIERFGKSPLWLHLMSGSAFVQGVLFLIAAGVAFCLLLGYRTRLATLLSFVLLTSLHARNEYILQSGDLMLRLLLFWGLFLPLGARFSVDAALDPDDASDSSKPYCSMASAALWLQVMSVYFFGALLKSDPVWMPDGTAVAYALQLDYLVTPLGVWLRQFPTLLQGLTYFTWSLELVGPITILCPLAPARVRQLCVLLFMALHVGFLPFLRIGLFPLISLAGLIALTPASWWDRLETSIKTPERMGLRLYYDADCGFCKRVCLLLRTFLLPRGVLVAPAQTDPEIDAILRAENTWIVVDHDGSRHLRWDGVSLVFRRSFLFWPLGWLFSLAPLRRIGGALYAWIAVNRNRLSRWTRWLLAERRAPYRAVPASMNLLLAALIAFMLYSNLKSLPQFPYRVWKPIDRVASKVLGQRWNMFAPAPPKVSGWYVVVGTLANGGLVDPVNGTFGEPNWEKPPNVAETFSNYRWRKYLMNLATATFRDFRPYYASYLCRRWNEGRTGELAMTSIQLYFLVESTNLESAVPERRRLLIWQQECGAEPAPFDSVFPGMESGAPPDGASGL